MFYRKTKNSDISIFTKFKEVTNSYLHEKQHYQIEYIITLSKMRILKLINAGK